MSVSYVLFLEQLYLGYTLFKQELVQFGPITIFLFFEGFQPQNFVILLLFFVKHSYVVIVKNTRDINKWGYFVKGWSHFVSALEMFQYYP